MEFNFQTERRAQNAPPIDLFNKLTLDSGSELNRPTRPRVRHPSIFMEGSKENRVCSFEQQQSEVNNKWWHQNNFIFTAIHPSLKPLSCQQLPEIWGLVNDVMEEEDIMHNVQDIEM